jgi:ELWxxDGT repeat protein
MIRKRDLALSLLVSGLAATAGAQSAYKVLDIYPGPQGSYPANFTRSGDVTFFTAEDPARGRELWRSDGTAAGTVLVKDIVAGPASSSPVNLTDVDGTLFFRVAGGLGHQLWKSDGTSAGTVQVAQLAPSGANVTGFVAAGGILFFSSNAGGTGQELWKSDGTAAGTVLVKDVAPGSAGANPGGITAFGTGVVFAATLAGQGVELWKSDGTAAGTVQVADIAPGALSSSPSAAKVVSGGRVYFSATRTGNGRELWASDGTAAGTLLVADLYPGASSSNPDQLAVSNGVVYFRAFEPTTGTELYRTDGTAAGTVRVADISPGTPSSYPAEFHSLGAHTIFTAGDDATVGTPELYRTDGTEGGTFILKDVNPGPQSSLPALLATLGARTYFSANDTVAGYELWRTDGTEEGTRLVRDIEAGPNSSFPGPAIAAGGMFLFRAEDAPLDAELWAVNGGAPEADAGPDQTVEDGEPVTLDGSASTDPQDDPITFEWRDASGTVLATTIAFTATFPPGIHEVTLLVSDGVNTGTDTVGVRVGRILDVVLVGEEGAGGTVTALPGGTCQHPGGASTSCAFAYEDDQAVELTATPAPGATFAGWEGACAGTGPCALAMTAAQVVTARFVAQRLLLVDVGGQENGLGSVLMDPPGELCTVATPNGSQICERFYTQGDTVVLTPLPAPGSVFVGWNHPACPGTGTCTVTMDFNQFVGARFLGPRTLFVDVLGEENGLGSVRIDPPGDLCTGGGPICERLYTQGDTVVLTPLPAPGSVFVGWNHPACPGTGTCTVTMDFNQFVGARFLGPRTLFVDVTGQEDGIGSVRIDPPGDLCTGGGPICERLYTQGDTVVLTPLPAPGSVFIGWTHPACPGTGTCSLSMDFHQVVGARFLGPRSLRVDVFGEENGLGSVRIDPPGEVCTLTTPGGSTACERSYTQGDPVVLTALPAPGSVFVGWNHPSCPGTGTCTISMDVHQLVGARFLGPRSLDVGVIATGDAAGSVRIDPPGTLCPVTTPAPNHCVETYAPDTVVQLTALPGPGTTFEGFGPPCTGTTPCTLTLAAASTVVQASFSRVNQPPAVALTAPAPGSVVPPSATALTASAADADGSVTRVAFFVDGFEVGASTTAPYGVLWTPAGPGPYTLSARATDDDGAVSDSAPVPVLVNAAPSIALLAPLPGATFVAPATVTLEADASDADGTIARVEFFEGATSRGFDTTSPYSVVWSNVTAGSHALTAVATDNHGATTAVPFTVLVSARITPAADAHVRDGSHANTNYGGSSTLEARRNFTSGHTRWTYLRFPITALSTVGGARLRLLGRLTETTGSPVQAQVMAVANTSWSENGLTWNNKPAPGPVPLATTALVHTSTVERWYEWDVTAYVQAEKEAGRTSVSFAIVEAANAPLASFRARSAAVGSRPELVLVP